MSINGQLLPQDAIDAYLYQEYRNGRPVRVNLPVLYLLAKKLTAGLRCTVDVRGESDLYGWRRIRVLWRFKSVGDHRAPEIRIYWDGVIATDGLATAEHRQVFRSLSDAIDRMEAE